MRSGSRINQSEVLNWCVCRHCRVAARRSMFHALYPAFVRTSVVLERADVISSFNELPPVLTACPRTHLAVSREALSSITDKRAFFTRCNQNDCAATRFIFLVPHSARPLPNGCSKARQKEANDTSTGPHCPPVYSSQKSASLGPISGANGCLAFSEAGTRAAALSSRCNVAVRPVLCHFSS